MELEDYGANPFSSDGLWRLSKFSTLALQPLESLPWNDELPGMLTHLIDRGLKSDDLPWTRPNWWLL